MGSANRRARRARPAMTAFPDAPQCASGGKWLRDRDVRKLLPEHEFDHLAERREFGVEVAAVENLEFRGLG